MTNVFDPERSLTVTSPKLTGDDVRIAQRALQNNVFDVDFLTGEPDGVWGIAEKRATLRAKEELGYSDANILPGYGIRLHEYLTGEVKISDDMKQRRQRDLAAARAALCNRVVKTAKEQVGTVERPPNSNETKYGEWFGANGVFWCAIFVSWVYDRSGSVGVFDPRKSRHSFCPTVMAWAAERENGLDQIRDPEPGNIVLYQFDDDSNADHIGIYLEKTGAETFKTIEGNTSKEGAGGSQNNGGGVYIRNRSMANVYRPSTGGRGFVRVLN